MTEDLKTEDLKTEDLKAEDLKAEVLKTEDLKTEDLKTEDLKAEVLKTEDLKSELTTAPAADAATADAGEKPSTIPPEEMSRLTDEIVGALKTVYDPEIPADIYELGLIYKVDVDDDRMVNIDMTLTTPNCPSAAELPAQVESAVSSVAGVREAKVTIVWDPPWDPSRMSDEARAVLNMW